VPTLGILAIVVYGSFFAYQHYDTGFLQDQISDYALFCSKDMVSDYDCPGQWFQGTRTVYTVIRDQQVVVEQRGSALPSRLTKCAVVDRQNWQCNIEKSDDFVAFVNGHYVGTDVLQHHGVRHVTRVVWIEAKEWDGKTE
jgi:hypothetical protein